MRLLLSGVDITVIALSLGHEQVTTRSVYLRPLDTMLAFLEAL